MDAECLHYTKAHFLNLNADVFCIESDSLLHELELLIQLLENDELIKNMEVNFNQNQILMVNTTLTIISCSIALGSFFAGAFGMNLDNVDLLQPLKNSFVIVSACSFTLIFIVFLGTYRLIRNLGVLPSFTDTLKSFAGTKEKRFD